MKLSIVIPAHNEEDNILEVINKARQSLDGVDYEIVVVDDHSTDATASLVGVVLSQYNNIRLMENRLERGFANALKISFNNIHSEAVLPVMADSCDDLSTIKIMLEKISEGYDVVCGCRYMKGGERIGGSKIKGFCSRFACLSLYYLLGLPTRDIVNSFKMYKKKVIDGIHIKSTSFEISSTIIITRNRFTKTAFIGF